MSLNLSQFDNLEALEFEKYLEEFKIEDEVLHGIKEVEQIGVFMFDCHQLKLEIQDSAQKTTSVIFSLLPKISYMRAKGFLDEVNKLIDQVQTNPSNLEKFVVF